MALEKIFKFPQCIFSILLLSPFRKVRALHFKKKLETPLPKDDSLMYFRFYVIISIWKRAGPFIWTNVNPLHPRMPCVKFGWNWLSGSWKEDERCEITTTTTPDKFRSGKLTWAFRSGDLKRAEYISSESSKINPKHLQWKR